MIHITDPKDCCGCTACASVCKHAAITMEPDNLGFKYPKINISKCTNCGLCEKVCAFNDNYDKSLNFTTPIAYGARHKNLKEVDSSRSGAAFIAISDYILNQNGIIYGVGFTGHFRICHKKALSKDERNEFKGSKYVQSDLTGIFCDVKKELKKGRIVLFSGTPCQTSGLRSFVGKNLLGNLFLVDIVCHGVSSPVLWNDYLINIEKTYKDHIIRVNFRDKQKFGWSLHHESFILGKNKKVVYPKQTFYNSISFRQSCYNCHFCNLKRPSDITIADFWGWEKTNPEFNKDDRGVNLILVNTKKGEQIFSEIQNDLIFFPAEIVNVLQPNLQKPTLMPSLRMQFEKDYIVGGYDYIVRKYWPKVTFRSFIMGQLKRFSSKILKL